MNSAIFRATKAQTNNLLFWDILQGLKVFDARERTSDNSFGVFLKCILRNRSIWRVWYFSLTGAYSNERCARLLI